MPEMVFGSGRTWRLSGQRFPYAGRSSGGCRLPRGFHRFWILYRTIRGMWGEPEQMSMETSIPTLGPTCPRIRRQIFASSGRITSGTEKLRRGPATSRSISTGRSAGHGDSTGPRTVVRPGFRSTTLPINGPDSPQSAAICVPSGLSTLGQTEEEESFGGRARTRCASQNSPVVGLPW